MSDNTDTQRLDWLEQRMGKAEVWVDTSKEEPRFSLDGGDTWHDNLRAALDAAIANDHDNQQHPIR